MADRKIIQDQKFLYGWDDVANTPIFSADHGATWNAIGGGGGAFQIYPAPSVAESIGDSRTTPGTNTVDGTKDGQFNAGVELGSVKAVPHGTAGNFATIGGGRDNYVSGEGSVVPGGQGNTVSGDNSAAWGRLNTVAHDRGFASGDSAVTRNHSERAHGLGEYTEGVAQERVVLLTREFAVLDGNSLPLYVDEIAGGTDEFATTGLRSYQVSVMVQASVGVAGGPNVEAAAWELRGLFVAGGGAVTQIGTTSTTFIANSDPTIFDIAPTLLASGAVIRVTGSDDGTDTEAIRWMARMVVTELPPVPGSGA